MTGIDAVLDDDFDMQIADNGDILTDDFFDTALLMSIYCERRATASEVPQSDRRRGWIGNESTPDFEIGSKVWLYEQSRVTGSLLRGIESVVLNSLQWLIDDNYAVKINADATLSNSKVTLEANIERPSSNVDKRFFELWDTTGLSKAT